MERTRLNNRRARAAPAAAVAILTGTVLGGLPPAPAQPAADASPPTTLASAPPAGAGGENSAHSATVAGRGCLPSHDGYLQARLRGANDLDIRWTDSQLQCDGGLRPAGGGIRLTFAGRTRQGRHRVRFVFGIDASPTVGVTRERAANVTVIFEGEGRLYSTRGDGKCTVDLLQQAPAAGVPGRGLLRVQARGFCIEPAVALDGRGELLLSRFDFAGLIHLGA